MGLGLPNLASWAPKTSTQSIFIHLWDSIALKDRSFLEYIPVCYTARQAPSEKGSTLWEKNLLQVFPYILFRKGRKQLYKCCLPKSVYISFKVQAEWQSVNPDQKAHFSSVSPLHAPNIMGQ